MKNILQNKNLIIFILIGTLAILIMTNFKSCSNANYTKEQAKQNEQAMKKVLTTEKNKNGELQTSVIAYEGKVKNLSSYSKELSEEVEALKNRKPSVIIKIKTVYVGDTSKKSQNTLKDKGDGNYDLEWKFASTDSSRILEGKSGFNAKAVVDKDNSYKLKIIPGTTQLTRDELFLDFTVGVANNKKTGYDEIFVTPKDPRMKIRKLEGAQLDKPSKPSRFSFSVQAGYGVVFTGNEVRTGPYVGLGISYNLGAHIKDLFKKKRKILP